MSDLCRALFGEVGLVSGRLRRFFNVETCSARSGLCRDVIGDVGLVSELVRQGRVSVGTCSARSN